MLGISDLGFRDGLGARWCVCEQEKLEAAVGEKETLQRRVQMAARQHAADLSDAQLQIQASLLPQLPALQLPHVHDMKHGRSTSCAVVASTADLTLAAR